jgi:hypothetical protein
VAAGALTDVGRELLVELAPVARRAVSLDPAALARLRLGPVAASILARLPFGVLVARTIAAADPADDDDASTVDVTVRADELIAWLDGERDSAPQARDEQWRSGLPPEHGWRRIDTVPDDAIRSVVRQGALALKEAGQSSQYGAPTQAMTDAMLDTVVLTATSPGEAGLTAQVALRTLTALTRMGFLPRGSHVHIDVAGRWTRVAAAYGTVYAEAAGLSLTLGSSISGTR